MKITGIKLYTVKSGDTGARGAAVGESQYWGGGWQAQTLISNPMSVHPKYARIRSLWMGGGQDPFVIEIFTDEGDAVGSYYPDRKIKTFDILDFVNKMKNED